MAQTAERTLAPIGIEHAFAKASLVEPSSDGRRYVHPTGRVFILSDLVLPRGSPETKMFSVIDRDCKRKIARFITDNEDGPRREVLSLHYSMEVDQREPEFHGQSQAAVIRMSRIGAAIPVTEEPIRSE